MFTGRLVEAFRIIRVTAVAACSSSPGHSLQLCGGRLPALAPGAQRALSATPRHHRQRQRQLGGTLSVVAARGGKSSDKMRGVKKENLPTKVCVVCDRPFTWRKKWERCGEPGPRPPKPQTLDPTLYTFHPRP